MICSADYGSPAVIIDWAVEPEDMVDGDHPEQHGYSIPCLALFPVPVQQSIGNSLPWAVAVKMVKM